MSEQKDILLTAGECSFSYRVAGILVRDGCVLLQKPTDAEEYAFPGGHVAFGELSKEALRREYVEEMGLDVAVGELKWVEETQFSWNGRKFQQISLSFLVQPVNDADFPRENPFTSLEAGRHALGQTIELHMVPLDKVAELTTYPASAAELLMRLNGGVEHITYVE